MVDWIGSFVGDNSHTYLRVKDLIVEQGKLIGIGHLNDHDGENMWAPGEMFVFGMDLNGNLDWSRQLVGQYSDEAQGLVPRSGPSGFAAMGWSTSFDATPKAHWMITGDIGGNFCDSVPLLPHQFQHFLTPQLRNLLNFSPVSPIVSVLDPQLYVIDSVIGDSMLCSGPVHSADASGADFGFEIVGNPVLDELVVELEMKVNDEVRIMVWSMEGKEVALVEQRKFGRGVHRIYWDAGQLAQGMYLLRVEAKGRSLAKRFVKS